LFSAGILWTRRRGTLDADIRTFGAIKSDFSKFMACPHGQGGTGRSPGMKCTF